MGNTHLMVSEVLAGAQAIGAETEIILLGELTIKECNGCHVCWKTGHCARNDDMNELYAKISDSDVIVITGKKENVEKAKNMIEAIQKELVRTGLTGSYRFDWFLPV